MSSHTDISVQAVWFNFFTYSHIAPHKEQEPSFLCQDLAESNKTYAEINSSTVLSFTKNNLQWHGQYLTSIFSEDCLHSFTFIKEKK